MKEIIRLLRDQHQEILKLINHKERILELIRFVEEEHHPLEENELFPFIFQQQFAQQGGPRCTYFMGLRLQMNPLDQIKMKLNEFYRLSGFRPTPYPMPAWLIHQTPLSIPMEEHVLGAELAQSIEFILSAKEFRWRQEFLQAFYDGYARLLQLHIDKEDNCLFVMCEQKLR